MPSLKIGDVIPNFTANSTKGTINFYEWQDNKYVVLFSHPADFTPVCTTELCRIAIYENYFTKKDVKLLALSCDTLEDHEGWICDLKKYCKDIRGEFPFPIISDETKDLAVQLDMIRPEEKDLPLAVRCLYIVDPKHVLRLSMSYPATTGRNVDEILRVLDSLKLVDKLPGVVTPVNWNPGEKVLVLPTAKESDLRDKNKFPNGIQEIKLPSNLKYFRTAIIPYSE